MGAISAADLIDAADADLIDVADVDLIDVVISAADVILITTAIETVVIETVVIETVVTAKNKTVKTLIAGDKILLGRLGIPGPPIHSLYHFLTEFLLQDAWF